MYDKRFAKSLAVHTCIQPRCGPSSALGIQILSPHILASKSIESTPISVKTNLTGVPRAIFMFDQRLLVPVQNEVAPAADICLNVRYEPVIIYLRIPQIR